MFEKKMKVEMQSPNMGLGLRWQEDAPSILPFTFLGDDLFSSLF